MAPSTEFSAGKVGVDGDRVIFVTDAKDKEVLYIINVDESVYTKDKKDVVVDALDALWTLINADQGVAPAGSKVAQATEALEAYDTLAEIPDADAKDAAQALVDKYSTGADKLTAADAADAQEWVDYQAALDAVQAAIAAYSDRAAKKAGYQSLIDQNKTGWPEGAAGAAENALDAYLLTLTAAEIAALNPSYDNVWNNVIAPVVQALQKTEALSVSVKDATELSNAVANAVEGATITLTDDVTLTSLLTVAADKEITIDLAGNKLTGPSANPAIKVLGDLTIEDSVGGGAISASQWGIYVGVKNTESGGTLTINGGNFTATEGCVGLGKDGSLVINGGTFTSTDNAVIFADGSNGAGNNDITINGGTFNGYIKSSGYIACGIAMFNSGTLTVNGGTFNVVGGVGILVRGGEVNLNDVTINLYEQNGLTSGKVGDSTQAIKVGEELVVDRASNYPDVNGIVINNSTDYVPYYY